MSEDSRLDKTNVVDGDTLNLRLDEAKKAPPALVLLMGPTGLMGRQWPLDKPELIVGRDLASDIHIDDKSVSKRHARISLVGEQVQMTDLQSTNGTEIAGQRLSANEPHFLNNNDRVKMGNIILKFLSQGNIEAAALSATYDRSVIDGLTQIFNKAHTMAVLEESFRKARLTETHLSVIVFDLDHFKAVNDTHGHQAGDYVLREVASIVKNQLIRSGDTFGRYGGEEFVIVLNGSPLQRSCEIAERIRSTIEKHSFQFQTVPIQLTVSLGVASIDTTMPTAEALFAKADQAAYQSKTEGRNRVSTV